MQNAAGSTDANDSDFNPNTALSDAVTVNPLNPLKKDVLTVDAALYSPQGSLGDYVWKDTNNDGIQNEAGTGVAGVILELYKNGVATGVKDTTDALGKYLFVIADSASYQVKIIGGLPAGCQISSMQNAAGSTDANDSDFNPTTGLSDAVTVNPLNPLKKNVLTVDAALYTPCVKPNAGPDQTLACSSTTSPTTADLTDATTGQKWKVLSAQPGTSVSVTTPAGLVSGMSLPGEYKFVLQTQTDSLTCRDTVSVIVPTCSCPTINVLTPTATVCKDSLWPTLQVAVVGSTTAGVAWYATATGGVPLATTLSYKPAGVATVTDTFYVALTNVATQCQALARVPVVVNVQNCTVVVDLALKKSISTKIAQLGDELTYTIKVYNQSATNATGVEVKDVIASTVQFVAGSFVASRGSASISGTTITWNIGNIAANGDTVTLTYKVKAIASGIHYNTAEISKTNEKDVDSTPGNGKENEDDIDRQCFTVPYKLCPGEKVEASVPSTLTNVQWFKDGGTTAVATGNVVLLSEVGSYTFTATNNTCPANGCCPIIIEPSQNCCPVNVCVPVTIRKIRK
jgi:uncharacterized repeat protein (TIGR01451 family)